MSERKTEIKESQKESFEGNSDFGTVWKLSYTKHWNREIEDGVKVQYSLISEELWPQRFPKNRSLERGEQKKR